MSCVGSRRCRLLLAILGEGEVLLGLGLCRCRVLLALAVARIRLLISNVRLRDLGGGLSCGIARLKLLEILPGATRHITVRLVALGFLDEFDDLLSVVELRVITS